MPYTVPNIYARNVGGQYRTWPANPANLQAAAGSYTTNGQGAILVPAKRLISAAGNYSLAGQIASLSYSGGNPDPYAFNRTPLPTDKYLDTAIAADNAAGSDATPWKTLSAARLQSLVAGQVLWVKSNAVFQMPNLTAGPSGTAANRITIAAYPGHSPIVNYTADVGNVFGGVNYWDFRNITFNCVMSGLCLGNLADFSLPGFPITNTRLIDCNGNKSSSASTDNAGIVWSCSESDAVEIIRGTWLGNGGSQNSSGLWFDYIHNLKIIGVTLDRFHLPIYLKHKASDASASNINIQISNNMISRATRYLAWAADYGRFTNNILNSCSLYPSERGGGVDGGNNNIITNNVFYGQGISLAAESGGNFDNYLRDNVFFGAAVFEDAPFSSNPVDNRTNTDYNLFGTGSSVLRHSSTNYSLAGYKSAFPTKEVHSIAGTITFAGTPTAGVTSPSTWDLSGPSGALTGSSVGGKIGVDVTKLLTVN